MKQYKVTGMSCAACQSRVEKAVGKGKPCVFKRISGFEHIDIGGNCLFFE